METNTDLTTNTLDQRRAEGETTIARICQSPMVQIREADRRQTPLVDGCSSLVEWVTGRTRDGEPVNMGRRRRTIPPQCRRLLQPPIRTPTPPRVIVALSARQVPTHSLLGRFITRMRIVNGPIGPT